MTVAPAPSSLSLRSNIGRGVLSGLAGTIVMTAFQKLIEMPLTGRSDSYEPANLVMRIMPMRRLKTPDAKKRLNYAAHFAVGAGWGAAHAVIARRGVRGQRAVATVFGTLWPGDVATTAALGLNPPPWRWSRRDLAIDISDKLVLAQATGALYDRLRRD